MPGPVADRLALPPSAQARYRRAVTNLPMLASVPSLVVHQKKEMLEVFTDFETRNRYEVLSPTGQTALYAAETGGGAAAFLTRSFLKNKRPFTMHLVHPHGGVAFTLRRPWTWFFSELHVSDGNGQPVGMIDQRFAFFSRRFVINGANGQPLGEIHGPFFRPWTFRIVKGGQEVGKISKKWSGLLREAFTDADTFGLQLSPAMEPALRVMALAATFLIDFLYFEDRD